MRGGGGGGGGGGEGRGKGGETGGGGLHTFHMMPVVVLRMCKGRSCPPYFS